MRLSNAIKKGEKKYWGCAHVRRNPSAPNEWFIMLLGKKHIPLMLVDDNESPIVSEDLNEFNDVFKQLGIREFTVYL